VSGRRQTPGALLWISIGRVLAGVLAGPIPAMAGSYVHGYTRKNGTYVAPHYHSPTIPPGPKAASVAVIVPASNGFGARAGTGSDAEPRHGSVPSARLRRVRQTWHAGLEGEGGHPPSGA
jgi:hypothetical protein